MSGVEPMHTWPEDGQRAVLVEPGQRGLVEAVEAGCGHHPVKGLEQRPDEDTELWPSQGAGLGDPKPRHQGRGLARWMEP